MIGLLTLVLALLVIAIASVVTSVFLLVRRWLHPKPGKVEDGLPEILASVAAVALSLSWLPWLLLQTTGLIIVAGIPYADGGEIRSFCLQVAGQWIGCVVVLLLGIWLGLRGWKVRKDRNK